MDKHMMEELNNKDIYDETICSSKDESIAKAVKIMLEEMKKNEIHQEYSRPKVSVCKGLIPILGAVISLVMIIVYSKDVSKQIGISKEYIIIISVAVYLAVLICFLKPLLIWMILIYQRFAPMRIRKCCRFKPSCSEYMKLSIEKYGVIRGVYRGCKRLCRCHWPNGGIDYP